MNRVEQVRSQADYFWQRVSFTVDPSQCWEWQAARHERGYGRVRLPGVGVFPAHRVAYILFRGVDPVGLEVDHTCENPPCVNPRHLEAVTEDENKRRFYESAAYKLWSIQPRRLKGGGWSYQVRWREGKRQRSRAFGDRSEAEAFAAEMARG